MPGGSDYTDGRHGSEPRTAALLACDLLDRRAGTLGSMTLRQIRFVTLLLAALAMTMECAHVLELPQKLQWDPALYSAVNSTLYRYFAIVGGPLQVGSIVAAAALAVIARRRRGTWGAAEVAGGMGLAAALAVWVAVVAPVNETVAAVMRSAPEQLPDRWLELRLRWELGHALGFVLQLGGFAALLASVVRDTPRHRPLLAVSHVVVAFDRVALAAGRGGAARSSALGVPSRKR